LLFFGDTLDDAMSGAEEAVAAWIEAALEKGQAVPSPGKPEAIRRNPDYVGWTFGVIAFDTALPDNPA
jgi:hypothetical protein